MKILVVDDNETAAKAMQKLLTLRGYEVDIVFDGARAIEKVSTFEPSVILMDIGLPDMTGYEVAKQLRTILHYTGTLIALTGYGQDGDKAQADEAGFNYHLTKPAGLADIEAILTKL
jgi:CheY-like chemotaxis protein